MEPLQRVTSSTVAVLTALRRQSGPTWGLLIVKETGRAAGTVYPILDRLERAGWVTSSWEETDRSGPRRRLYVFTPEGATAAAELTAARSRTAPIPRPTTSGAAEVSTA